MTTKGKEYQLLRLSACGRLLSYNLWIPHQFVSFAFAAIFFAQLLGGSVARLFTNRQKNIRKVFETNNVPRFPSEEAISEQIATMLRSDKRRNDDNNFTCRNTLVVVQHARGGDDSTERPANINSIRNACRHRLQPTERAPMNWHTTFLVRLYKCSELT